MARWVRADVFHPSEVSVLHCVQRCARQCFLCADDPPKRQQLRPSKPAVGEFKQAGNRDLIGAPHESCHEGRRNQRKSLK